jgi:hypothetical protein
MIERRIPKGYTHEVGALGREIEGSKPHALGVLAVAISQGSEPWYSVPRQEIEISWEAIEHLSKRERERERASEQRNAAPRWSRSLSNRALA